MVGLPEMELMLNIGLARGCLRPLTILCVEIDHEDSERHRRQEDQARFRTESPTGDDFWPAGGVMNQTEGGQSTDGEPEHITLKKIPADMQTYR